MASFDVRRLAAVDLHGERGSALRRRLILAEFVLGVLSCGVCGALALGRGGVAGALLGVVLLGAAVNYAPLAVHAVRLSRPGALARELAGVDLPTELRRATWAQALVLVPAVVAALAVRQAVAAWER